MQDEPDWFSFGSKRSLFELIKDNPGITPQVSSETAMMEKCASTL